MGNDIFNDGVFSIHIDPAIDPGHPPFIGWWQALGWKLLGHKLWVSHAIMIPFHIALMSQLFRFAQFFLKKPIYYWMAFIWMMADPTLLAQFVFVSPETIQLFFFFLAINGILYKKKWQMAIGLAFLGIVSYRGMMLCAGVFLFDLIRYLFVLKKPLFSNSKKFKLWPYLIGAIPALCFILWHKWATGWVYSHADSPWVSTSGIVDFKGFLRNILILGRNALDFGRVAVFLILGLFIVRNKSVLQHKDVRSLFLLAIFGTSVIVVVSLVLTNPMAHRYFLASYITIHLLTFFILIQFYERYKKWAFPLVISILLTGNFWIYPERLAQGWDASLAGMPYFQLRQNAVDYLNAQQIPIDNVATFFPNIVPLDYIDLKGDQRSFVAFTGMNEYVLYSTVFNLTDQEYDQLDQQYTPVQIFRKNRIEVQILKRK